MEAAVAPIIQSGIDTPPWGWNPLSAYFGAMKEAQNEDLLQREMATKEALLPGQLKIQGAQADYYRSRADLADSKIGGSSSSLSTGIIEEPTSSAPGSTIPHTPLLDDEPATATKADTAGKSSSAEPVDTSSYFADNNIESNPLKEVVGTAPAAPKWTDALTGDVTSAPQVLGQAVDPKVTYADTTQLSDRSTDGATQIQKDAAAVANGTPKVEAPSIGDILGSYSKTHSAMTREAILMTDQANRLKMAAQAMPVSAKDPASYSRRAAMVQKFLQAATKAQDIQRDLVLLDGKLAAKTKLSDPEIAALRGLSPAAVNHINDNYLKTGKVQDFISGKQLYDSDLKTTAKQNPQEEYKFLQDTLNKGVSAEQAGPIYARMQQLVPQITGQQVPQASDVTGISGLQDTLKKLNTAVTAGVKSPININGTQIVPSKVEVAKLTDAITAKAIEAGSYFDPSDAKAIKKFNAQAPAGTSFMLKGSNKVYKTNPQADPEMLLAAQKEPREIAPATGGLWNAITPKTKATLSDPSKQNFHDQSRAFLSDAYGNFNSMARLNQAIQGPGQIAMAAQALSKAGITPSVNAIIKYFSDPGTSND